MQPENGVVVSSEVTTKLYAVKRMIVYSVNAFICEIYNICSNLISAEIKLFKTIYR